MKDSTLYFCTLFDSNYLSRGMVMYESLEKCCPDFHLYIFAFDDKSYQILIKQDLADSTIISLKEFEDDELLKVKPTRSRAEYCWTCSSSTILYCISKYNLSHCTYIDADLYFYSNPGILIDEMGDNSIMITEHRYSPQYEKSVASGKYCVQFIIFKNDVYGMKALKWWRDRCIEWCYARHEDGKFGDQKYLDDWTTRFEKVWVMQNLGGGLAAWNVQQYAFFEKVKNLWGTEKKTKKEFPLVFYHFHYVKFYENNFVELGRRELNKQALSLIYKPYIQKLMDCSKHIETIDNQVNSNGKAPLPSGLKHFLVSALRKLKSVYHIYSINDFLKDN